MSYNVVICTAPVPAGDNAAWEVLDSLISVQGRPPPVFRELYDALTARYPCIRTIPDDKVGEEGVFGVTGRYGTTSATVPPSSA